MKTFLSLTLAALCLPWICAGQTPPPRTTEADREQVAASLQFQQGEITLKGNLAKLNVPKEFRYLDPADTEKVIVKLWGNPPREFSTLGMLFPAGVGPLDRGSWGVVITYKEEGYVKDNDADKIDYTDLLKKMQGETKSANAERQKQGYAPIELVGWAAPPRYDKATHKLYWAKELAFANDPAHTLNYDIRILGRRGVLVLTAIAGMDQLQEIQNAAPQVLQMVDFNQGNRYADFDPTVDKVATYGLAALVAGGIAAKLGLFKILIGVLIAAKKFIIIALAALATRWKKFFGRKDKPPAANSDDLIRRS